MSYWELLSLHDQRFSLSLSLTEQDAAQALRIDLDDAEHICNKAVYITSPRLRSLCNIAKTPLTSLAPEALRHLKQAHLRVAPLLVV